MDEYGVDVHLRQAAEQEMRRVLDAGDGPSKRHKGSKGIVGRFDYGAPAMLADGAAGFVITCHMGR